MKSVWLSGEHETEHKCINVWLTNGMNDCYDVNNDDYDVVDDDDGENYLLCLW